MLTDADFDAEYQCDLWPDNVQAVNFFMVVGGQWLMGTSGPYALNYAVLPEMWKRCKVKKRDRDSVFAELRVLEEAALAEMRRET